MRKIQCETCPTRMQGAICDLPADALAEFRAAGATSIYRPRQVIFCEGSPPLGLYLVCHGEVKLYHADRFDREHILEVARAGAVLGEFSFDDSLTHSVSAEAMSESQLCFLPRERLARFLERHPGAAVKLIAALSTELAAARRKARDLALKGAESRLASWLLELARTPRSPSNGDREKDKDKDKGGERIEFPYSRREIAEMIGVSTETAIRLLGKLRERQLIGIERRSVILRDVERLKRIAHHE